MAVEVRVRRLSAGALVQLRRRLGDLTGLERQLRTVLLGHSKRAFLELGVEGGTPWPPRYPRQKPPFVDFAGVLRDLRERGTIDPKRFSQRPETTLRDSGDLFRSLTAASTVTAGRSIEIVVGSSLPYASLQQFGTDAHDIAISPAMKKALADYFRAARKRMKRIRQGREKGKSPKVPRGAPLLRAIAAALLRQLRDETRRARRSLFGRRPKAARRPTAGPRKPRHRVTGDDQEIDERLKKMGFFFGIDTFTQAIIARPFVDATPVVKGDVIEATERWLEGEAKRALREA